MTHGTKKLKPYDNNKLSNKTMSRRDKRRLMEGRWSKVQLRRRILGIIPELR